MLLAIFVTFVFALFSLSALYGCFQIKAYPHPHHLKKVKDHQGFKFQTRKKKKEKKKKTASENFYLKPSAHSDEGEVISVRWCSWTTK